VTPAGPSRRTHRLAARLVAPILAAARACRLDPKRLLVEAGVDEEIARKGGTDAHVTLAQYYRLWELAAQGSGAEDFALRAASALGTDSFGVIGFACMTSPTVGESFARLARYYGVLSSASRWSRAEEARGVALVFEVEPGPPLGTRCAVEFALAESVHFSTLMVGRRVPLLEARLPYPPPRDEEPYRRHFRAPLRWNAPQAALVLEPRAPELPLLKADATLLAYFEKQADALAARHASEEELPLRVRRLVMEALPSGPPSLETLARALGVSPRSLRRRLGDEGTSFQALVEETRSALARQYLQASKLTVSEIAFLVGFSELSPFQRAFRRWTGTSPRAFRERALERARRS
jgi:AraC-like DNA-binding protein